MAKHRAVVAGYDSAYENPDGTTGRPKGVQTAADMRIATTYDVLAEGVFAAYAIPTIAGSPTDTATITPFMAAIESPAGGFYVVQIDADETFTINLANTGLVKIFVQQQDWEVDNVSQDSEVVIGVVYGSTPIPDGALLLFESNITSQTSTSGLSFTPAFKWTGAASGVIRVPNEAALDDVVVKSAGIRALALDGSGEWFFGGDNEWHETTIANPKLEALAGNLNSSGEFEEKTISGAAVKNGTLTPDKLSASPFYKSGDSISFSGNAIVPALVTSGRSNLYLAIPLAKDATGLTPTITTLTGELRGPSGYLSGVGSGMHNLLSIGTVGSVEVLGNTLTLYISKNSGDWDSVNNTTGAALLKSFAVSFS